MVATPEENFGGCQCGAIRYRVRGAWSSMVCHCRTCRRVSGGLVVGWVSFATKDYSVEKGQPREFSSSPSIRRTFCGQCGTQLTYLNTDSPESIDIATGTLDDPDRFVPTHHSWLSHRIAWVSFDDGLPRFPKGRYDPE